MRSAMLLLATVLLFVCPNISKPARLTSNTDPLDSLSKYSYLVAAVQKNNQGSDSVDVGTGFFIRDSNNRLYLVMSYHLATHCRMLDYRRSEKGRPDILRVWYVNDSNRYTCEEFPFKKYAKKPCNARYPRPDIDTMDVTGHFRDVTINSIEKMAPHLSLDSCRLENAEQVYAFGFPGSDIVLERGGTPVRPTFAWSRPIVRHPNLGNSGHFYSAISPAMLRGFSGAPVFRIGKQTGRMELAGVQALSDTSNTSLIVNGRHVAELVHWK